MIRLPKTRKGPNRDAAIMPASQPEASRIRIAIHGGAGDLAPNAGPQPEHRAALHRIASAARQVLLDGGIRRGSDVAKALALGARAVMIGRAYLWGLAANGQTGVENVLDIMRGGIDSALMGLGRRSIHDLTRDDIIIPEGFEKRFGETTS